MVFLATPCLELCAQTFSPSGRNNGWTTPEPTPRVAELPELDFESPPDAIFDQQPGQTLPPSIVDRQPNHCDDCVQVPENRPAFIQWKDTTIIGTWLSGSGNQLGLTDIDLRGTIKFPRLPLFWMAPRYNMFILDGPIRTDLPGQLYTASLGFNWFQPINQNWHAMFAVSPGVYSDFQTSSSDAIRITGRALAFYKWTDDVQVAMGVVYLDRDDISILPAVGLVYSPDEDTKIEVMFPKPKVSRRYKVTDRFERWLYVSGEFGGGSWAIERANGTDDVFTYRDFRLVTGFETKYTSGPKTFFEFAYVFGRRVEYESGIGDYDPNDTAMLRAGFKF